MRKRQLIVAILLSQIASFAAKAQPAKCATMVDTFYYVTVDIRDAHAYPVTMSGVGKKLLKGRWSTAGVDSFLAAFYREYSYVPDLTTGYKKMLSTCMGDSLSKADRAEIATFTDRTSSLALHRKIRLKSGQTAFIDVVKIGGTFWKADSRSPGVAISSNEYPIARIPEISDCYVPYRIGYYRKPKQNDW